jgi:hypothetical protein
MLRDDAAMGSKFAGMYRLGIAGLVVVISLNIGFVAPGSALAASPPARSARSLPCSNQTLKNCPRAGLYAPDKDPVIFNDKVNHYRIVWIADYVQPPPRGQEPVWFYVYVLYENYGKSALSFSCQNGAKSDDEKEWFFRDGKDIGYVPAGGGSCTQNPHAHETLEPGHLLQQFAKFNNVPWKGDQIAIEWPQNQQPTATSSFVAPYELYRWAAPAKTQPKRTGNNLVKLEKLAGMIWQAVGIGNTVCDILRCKFVPPNTSKVISFAGNVQTIGDLAAASAKAVVVGSDLAALNKTITGHKPGTPFSAAAKRAAKKAWNDTRSLHETLDDLVPGLSAAWPVPPPKR